MSAQQEPLTLSRLNNSDVATLIHKNAKIVRQNDVTKTLSGHALRRGEVVATKEGALVAYTGKFTGRSAKDKFIVRDRLTENTVWRDNNNAIGDVVFDLLPSDMVEHIIGRTVFEQQLFVAADPKSRSKIGRAHV